ncbi:MAG: hypothetical protein LC798_12325 [Chloroflexi bacterium]|nr:hypothetical protein [Chloroflexota bacterium]
MSRLRQRHDARVTVAHLCDDSLRRLATTHRRRLEDIATGDLHSAAKPSTTAQLRDVQGEQELRAALRECWLAREDGTDSYTDFIAAGGLAAVIVCDGLAPSYQLAVFLDRWMYLLGFEHVLSWTDERLPDETRARYAGGLITGECPRCERDHANDLASRTGVSPR